MAGVYLSYPFCAQKCTYCNFASGVRPRELAARYHETLLEELRGAQWPWLPETVYLGGGTPSSMEPALLAELLRAIPGRWKEATLECAPGGLSPEKVRAWIRAGVNRLSFGVQSFVQNELRRTGRRHTAEIVEAEVKLLRANGIANFNIDLIAGLPGQTRASWAESLEWIERLEPPHVSVYIFEVDEDSTLGKEIILGGERFGVPDLPSEELTADFYESAVEVLRAAGIERYEISNFAQPGFESLHNLKYWRREPYLGFGSDAHSFDGQHRWEMPEDALDYIEARQRGAAPKRHRPDPEEEKFFLGLRLSAGITTDPEDWRRHGSVIERFIEEGLLERLGDRIRLTSRGVLLSNEVFQEFLS